MTMKKSNLIQLKSGLRLVTVDMPELNSVTVLAMVGVGSRYEEADKAGISHFLEHLPFKGTKNYPSSMAIAEAIDGVGGKHNAFTGKEYTGYWVKVGANKLELALDVVSDLVQEAKLNQEDIDKERGVIIEEINMYQDQPQAKVGDVFEELIYQGSPLARTIIGTKETVGNLQKADFLAHWDKWYDHSHVVVGVVGRIPDGIRLQELVEKLFAKGKPRRGGGSYFVPVSTGTSRDKQTKPRVKVEYKKTEQAHFHLGFPGINRFDEDRYAMAILATIAGGNSSSRLFNEIREKRGLAYYAYATADLNRDLGSFYAFEGVSLDKAEEAVKVTMAEFDKIAKGEIDSKELNRAKEYIMGKTMLDLEDSARMADFVVEQALFEHQVLTVAEEMKKYQEVTLEQINRLAKKVIDPTKLNLAIIGPYKQDKVEEWIK